MANSCFIFVSIFSESLVHVDKFAKHCRVNSSCFKNVFWILVLIAKFGPIVVIRY